MNEKKRAALTVAAVNDGNGQILLKGFKPKKDIITDRILSQILLQCKW